MRERCMCLTILTVCLLVSLARQGANASERTILPLAPPLSPELTVCDISRVSYDEMLFYISVQGVVNQSIPRVYLVIDTEYDAGWLEWLLERGYVRKVTRVEPGELVSRFRSEISGAVVYDPDFLASINLATMVAAVNRFVIVSPGIAETCGLPVKSDLRGRFRDNAKAYSWAVDHLMPHLSKRVLCSYYPLAAQHRIRDYLIQQKVFTFWVVGPEDQSQVGASPREREVIERAFRLTKANSPVIGFWYAGDPAPGISEYEGLVWAGGFGKPTICHDWATNTSIHAAVRVDPGIFRQKPSAERSLERKTYVAVSVTESGDAPWYWERCMRTTWGDPNRGKVPISWCLGPATLDIHPAVLEWYYRNATPNDFFFTAMSGATYTMPHCFALNTADPEAVWREFFELTDLYMRKLDLDAITLHNDAWLAKTQYEDSAIFRRYANNLPLLRTILADFGRMEDLDPARTVHRTSRNVTVFHCLNRWDIKGDPGEWLAEQIRKNTPPGKPGFMHVMALSWTFTPTHILKAKEILGESYRFVTVRELDLLCRAAGRQGPTARG